MKLIFIKNESTDSYVLSLNLIKNLQHQNSELTNRSITT
jgi:hypothetical protein